MCPKKTVESFCLLLFRRNLFSYYCPVGDGAKVRDVGI